MDGAHWVIIGYGNSLRRDDGAGLLLAEKLAAELRSRRETVICRLCHQLTPDQAEELATSHCAHVIFVDAERNPDPAAQIQVQPLSQSGHTSMTLGHACAPETVLAICERLYKSSPSGWLVTIPVEDIGYGDAVSDSVRERLNFPGVPGRLIDQIVASEQSLLLSRPVAVPG